MSAASAAREWFTRHDGTRGGALRRIGGVVCLVNGTVVAAAPFASTRSPDQRAL